MSDAEIKALREQSRKSEVAHAGIQARLKAVEMGRAEDNRRRSSVTAIIVTSTLSLIGALVYLIFSLSR